MNSIAPGNPGSSEWFIEFVPVPNSKKSSVNDEMKKKSEYGRDSITGAVFVDEKKARPTITCYC